MDTTSLKPENSCAVKAQLQADLETAHRWVMTIDDRLVNVVLRGDLGGLKELEEFLTQARESRKNAIDDYLAHINEHGC